MFKSTSKGTPSAALLVAVVALGAGATVAALGFKTVAPVPPGIPKGADLITITDTPVGRPVPAGFVGLSLEFGALEPWAGSDPAHADPILPQLITALAPGSRPVLRIGGNSTDWTWYSPHHLKPPAGIQFTVDSTWLAVARRLVTVTDAQPILGLNLKANDPALLSAEASAFSTVGSAPQPPTMEIGNEPEKFGTRTYTVRRPHHRAVTHTRRYTFHFYAGEFAGYSRLIPASTPLAGPAFGNPGWWPRIPALLAHNPRIGLATVHTYPLHNCVAHPRGPVAPSIFHLLARPASEGTAASIAPAAVAAHRAGVLLRTDELNSVSCGGARGVSDTFASSLWALDTLFAFAQQGIDGVNIHAFPGAAYSPFEFRQNPATGAWSAMVKPLYLGLLAFTRMAPAGARLLRTGTASSPDLRIWAAQSRGGTHVALINASATAAHTIAIKLPAARGAVRLERLASPSLASTAGATLGGQSFGRATTTGHLAGRRRITRLSEIGPEIYLLQLPAGSAALLSR